MFIYSYLQPDCLHRLQIQNHGRNWLGQYILLSTHAAGGPHGCVNANQSIVAPMFAITVEGIKRGFPANANPHPAMAE